MTISENHPVDGDDGHISRRELMLHLKAMEWRLRLIIFAAGLGSAGLSRVHISDATAAINAVGVAFADIGETLVNGFCWLLNL